MLMKKVLPLIVLALLAVAGVRAQEAPAYRLGQAESAAELSHAVPNSIVKVQLIVEKESVRSGPYARFAQKYLGVMVPLTDKDIWSVKEASLVASNPGAKVSVDKGIERSIVLSSIASGINEMEFPKVTPDRMTAGNRSQEEMARDAASLIFSLRKHRLDLITGNAGENVFGSGLDAALREINRLEEECLALFLGKRSVRREIREFEVVPQVDQNNYIVCRFSAESGVLPESDLSGTPIILSVKAEQGVTPVADRRSKGLKTYYQIPARVQCTLLDGNTELARREIPLYQFGSTVAGGEAATER